MDSRKPDAEVAIDAELVQRLLAEQHPDLATEPLSFVDEGWDNVTYRIGSRWAARLPRRVAAVDLLLNEQRWLPDLGAHLGIQVPIPVRMGRSSALFPWPWSVVPWIEGRTADLEPLGRGQGDRLAAILRALHSVAPDDAPTNPFRGVPLRARADLVRDRLPRTRRGDHEIAVLSRLWAEGLEAPGAEERVWLHGDLHPRNAVVQEGALVGLLDWGDMTAGDAATDLAAAWTLLRSEEERRAFRTRYGGSEALWLRARAWAVLFGSALSGSGEAQHEPMGDTILDELLRGQPD